MRSRPVHATVSVACASVVAVVEKMSVAAARRVALAAQGLGAAQPTTVTTRSLTALLARIRLLQLDSVSVFARSHYLPAFSRLGVYDTARLDHLVFRPHSGYVEYLAHEAAVIPVEDWPLLRWRMDGYRRTSDHGNGWARAHEPLLDWLRQELASKGALASSEVVHEKNHRTGPWWGWSAVKQGLETLFRWGEVATAGRAGFQRRYALAEQVIPPRVLDREIDEPDAIRELVRRAARAHGVGTVTDLADYYRIDRRRTTTAVHELHDAGELIPVNVEGWTRGTTPLVAWRHRDARLARRAGADTLLTPFDPMVWNRARALRLFDFHYRIEIYTPRERRVYGYYVLPVLIGERIRARVDLKSDRRARSLLVQAAWREPDPAPSGRRAARRERPLSEAELAQRVAHILREAARWQGLDDVVVVAPRGDLAASLRAALATG